MRIVVADGDQRIEAVAHRGRQTLGHALRQQGAGLLSGTPHRASQRRVGRGEDVFVAKPAPRPRQQRAREIEPQRFVLEEPRQPFSGSGVERAQTQVLADAPLMRRDRLLPAGVGVDRLGVGAQLQGREPQDLPVDLGAHPRGARPGQGLGPEARSPEGLPGRLTARRQGGRDPALPRAGGLQDRHRQAHGRVPDRPVQLHEHPRSPALGCNFARIWSVPFEPGRRGGESAVGTGAAAPGRTGEAGFQASDDSPHAVECELVENGGAFVAHRPTDADRPPPPRLRRRHPTHRGVADPHRPRRRRAGRGGAGCRAGYGSQRRSVAVARAAGRAGRP